MRLPIFLPGTLRRPKTESSFVACSSKSGSRVNLWLAFLAHGLHRSSTCQHARPSARRPPRHCGDRQTTGARTGARLDDVMKFRRWRGAIYRRAILFSSTRLRRRRRRRRIASVAALDGLRLGRATAAEEEEGITRWPTDAAVQYAPSNADL